MLDSIVDRHDIVRYDVTQFHCDDCGICRVGGRENYFHCKKCGCWYALSLRNNHSCVENSMRHHCPIFYEYLFDSLKDTTVMKCGHTMHSECCNEMIKRSIFSCPICSKSVMDMSRIWQRLDEEDSEGLSEAERELEDMKEELKDAFPVGPLIKKCCTRDLAKAVSHFLDAILDKTLRSTVALFVGRGRGKSVALGLAIAGAVAAGYSNIFVTAPSPKNLKTLFDFITKGFDMLEYKEHLDYDIVKSSNPELKKVTTRINIYKQHRQTIQYIQPGEHTKLSQVKLLVVDEAAAIPLPIVKSLLGPYL